MTDFSFVRESEPPPKIAEGDVIVAKIISYEVVDSQFKNADGSTKKLVQFQLNYDGFEFRAWMSYYTRPSKTAKIVKIARALYSSTQKNPSSVDEVLQDLHARGSLFLECTGHRTFEDEVYPKFSIVGNKLPPVQTALSEQPVKPSIQLVRFITPYSQYNVEDVASLSKKTADSLINLGIAIPIDEA